MKPSSGENAPHNSNSRSHSWRGDRSHAGSCAASRLSATRSAAGTGIRLTSWPPCGAISCDIGFSGIFGGERGKRPLYGTAAGWPGVADHRRRYRYSLKRAIRRPISRRGRALEFVVRMQPLFLELSQCRGEFAGFVRQLAEPLGLIAVVKRRIGKGCVGSAFAFGQVAQALLEFLHLLA